MLGEGTSLPLNSAILLDPIVSSFKSVENVLSMRTFIPYIKILEHLNPMLITLSFITHTSVNFLNIIVSQLFLLKASKVNPCVHNILYCDYLLRCNLIAISSPPLRVR